MTTPEPGGASDLRLRAGQGGALVPVRAAPNARRPGVLGVRDGALRVAVAVPPEKGRANAAIVEILAEAFGCARSRVRLVSGETRREKLFLVEGVSIEAAREALARRLPGDAREIKQQ